MRELLSSLPDPGPMPEHVTARIAASIDEQARLDPEQPVPTAADRQVIPVIRPGYGAPDRSRLGRPRPRRRTTLGWSAIGAVAAVVAVGVVGTVLYDRVLGVDTISDASAQYVPSEETAVKEPAPGKADGSGGGTSPEEQTVAAADEGVGGGAVVLHMDEGTFAAGAQAVLERATAGSDSRALPPAFEVSGSAGRPLPQAETENCVRSTGQRPAGSGWVAAAATVAETQVVVVSDQSAKTPQAWAVSADCVAGTEAAILHGPTDLP
jgi:hypothetical protein